MAQFTVRSIKEDVKTRLKLRAIHNQTGLEDEVRNRLRVAVNDTAVCAPTGRLGTRIATRVAAVGLDKPLPELHGQPLQPMIIKPSTFWTPMCCRN